MSSDLTPRTLAKFQAALLDWFAAHRRDLPWRASRDPYRIWVAEIMLQQTRIAAVLPYYHRFLKKFPTVASLRRARLEEVLKLWSGLGYYSRARNLHRAAREIASRHGGKFPRSLEDALALPGIGRYTAAAVLSIAYDVPLAVLDGNVARVLARLGAVRGDLREPTKWRRLSARAQAILAQNSPGDWNQALMELGEVICTPQSPRCEACPVSRWCQARAKNLTAEIPAVRKKRAPVKVRIAAAVLRDPQGRTILVRDPGAHDHVLFSRMWQFPAVEVSRDAKPELARHLRAILGVAEKSLHLEALPQAHHGVTFRNITLLPFLANVALLPKLPRTRILPLDDLSRLSIQAPPAKSPPQPLFPIGRGNKHVDNQERRVQNVDPFPAAQIMPKLPRITPRKLLRILLRAGFYLHHQTGSHANLRHQSKTHLRLVVPRHGGDLAPKTLKSIITQAEMTVDEFVALQGK